MFRQGAGKFDNILRLATGVGITPKFKIMAPDKPVDAYQRNVQSIIVDDDSALPLTDESVVERTVINDCSASTADFRSKSNGVMQQTFRCPVMCESK